MLLTTAAELVATCPEAGHWTLTRVAWSKQRMYPGKKEIITQIRRNKIESPSKRKLEIPRCQLSPVSNTAKPGCRSSFVYNSPTLQTFGAGIMLENIVF